MRKILMIGHEQELNGASRSLLGIADMMIARGQSIYVLTSFADGPFYEELKKRELTIIVEPFYRWCVYKSGKRNWIKCKYLWSIRWNRINIATAKKISEYVRKERIDIIHTNTSVINIGALISKYSGIKHVWHLREFADLDFNMYPIISKKRYYRFMNRFTDCFICVSKAVADHYDMLDPKKKYIVYNGICSPKGYLDKENHNGEKIRILIAGKVDPAKGQDEAINACTKVYEYGITNFELLIAGKGEKYFNVPEEIHDNVMFLGQVEDMASLRETVDIELMCSKAEAFGRVTAEAMMAGIPVIGSNTGGTPELIQDGVTGFLYEKGNIKQLSEKIIMLMSDKELRERLGLAAKKYAYSYFTIARCVDSIEEIYKEILI